MEITMTTAMPGARGTGADPTDRRHTALVPAPLADRGRTLSARVRAAATANWIKDRAGFVPAYDAAGAVRSALDRPPA